LSRILLATRSVHKATEIRHVLAGARKLELITLSELPLPETAEEEGVENAATFIENAAAKALYFSRRTGLPTIADDSGLEVEALGNAPGVRTRRFALDAGRSGLSGSALDQANNDLLLERLRSIAPGARAARYVCAAAFADAAGQITHAIGTCAGEIAREARGNGGFGYDPLFFLPQLGLTFAELSRAQKDARSHRARAFRALAIVLPSSVDPNPRVH
jgi:XTP/dITP diphosphohydrolase